MFSVNIKGQRDPNNLEMVKLTMIFYKSGYNRVPRVLYITGLYSAWNPKAQLFDEKQREAADKNNLLRHERLKYLKVAEKWEYSNKNWTPQQLAHFFDAQYKSRERYMTVSELLDTIIDQLCRQERLKNGRIFTSVGTAGNYSYLKKSLEQFTRSKYHRDFSKYQFRDIDTDFLRSYILHEQQRGAKRGNNGGIQSKLKTLRATCAKDRKIYGVNLAIFKPFKHKIKAHYSTPKAVLPNIIRQIEEIDRTLLQKREDLYLDLFLFSYYAGGMSPIDICFLEHSRIKKSMLIYERIKLDRTARVILTDKAIALIDKYRNEGYMNFVFPLIKKCKMTQIQQYSRVERIVDRVNKTLKVVCEHLGIEEHITWSCARSSFISRMIDAGYHPLQVAELAGNSPQTIYKYYYAITNKEQMRQEMNLLFNGEDTNSK